MKQKVLYMLISILVAFGIWSYVVTVVSPESEATYYNIPVVLSNESVLLERGLMVTSDTNPTVTLQLRGNRTDLNSLKNSDISVVADLSKINAPGDQLLSCAVSFTGSANAFEILTQNPSRIVLKIVEWSTKEIPVNVYCDTTQMLPNYIAYKGDVVQDYETVTITGPKDVVDLIAEARIDITLDQTNTETLNKSYRYTLSDADGLPVDAASIKTNAAEVNVTVKIQQVKEIQLLLNVTYGGGATEKNTSIVLDYETIKVAGSDKLLEGLEDTLILGSVELAKILEDTVLTLPVKLPDGLENLSGVKEVEAKISFNGLATKTLEVSKIYVSNIPAGMSYDAAKAVEVTVRGPEELIETIGAENLSVLVDLTNGELGENLYKAKILVDTVYEAVGAIDSYEVLVTLTEIQEDAT